MQDKGKKPVPTTALRIAEVHATFTSLVRLLVDTPEAVELVIKSDTERTAFDVIVAPGETGMVVGGGGRNARSLRVLLMAATANDAHHFSINVDDPLYVSTFKRGSRPS